MYSLTGTIARFGVTTAYYRPLWPHSAEPLQFSANLKD